MEEYIRKISAIIMGVLSVAVSIAVISLSAVQADAHENEKISGLELMDSPMAQQQNVPENQIQIELPKGITQEDIQVENDVLSQCLTITIPGIEQEYFYEHPLVGSSAHIDSLMFGSGKDTGIIEISFNEVYEIETVVENSRLYVDFVSPHELYEKVIVIDAGHGGDEPGAIKKGIREKDLNLAILRELKVLLDAHENWKVYYTRLDDTDVSLQARVGLANKAHADLFLSIHNNAVKSGQMSSYNGTLVMYDEKEVYTQFGTKRFAEICLEELVATTESTNLGVANGNSIYIIRTSQVPVALAEVGFMSNEEELAKLNTPAYQKLAAQGLYNGIVRAIEEGF